MVDTATLNRQATRASALPKTSFRAFGGPVKSDWQLRSPHHGKAVSGVP